MMSNLEAFDVVVVGGGPGGSTCAGRLVRAGIDVLVIDRKTFPRDKICAGWVTPQVFEVLNIDPADYGRAHVCQPITGFRTGLIGQDEIDIIAHADITVVVLVPGMGDDIQAIKAGILEVADVFAINKWDHPGAERTEQEIAAERSVPIVRTIATQPVGIPELIAAIEAAPRRAKLTRL